MYIATNFLALHPINPNNTIELSVLSHILQEIKFTATQQADNRFELGDSFLSHIAFLGCSPDIELSPHPTKAYSYVQLCESDKIQLTTGENIKIPICKHCKKSLNWLIEILKKPHAYATINCQHCEHEIDILRLNWRKSGFLSRCSIHIGNIYEAEAVPNESLLIKLMQATGFEWKYSYIRQPVKL